MQALLDHKAINPKLVKMITKRTLSPGNLKEVNSYQRKNTNQNVHISGKE